jgi:hypothetical protein
VNIGDVNFPESLLAARKEARLVVFAGAGVSVPPPSNYPNFKNLAIEVSGGRLALADDQPIDQFLGQLNDLKVQVHRLVREILDNPQSKPNSLHFDLLRLFDGFADSCYRLGTPLASISFRQDRPEIPRHA